jgi:hypothetical protein
MSTPSPEGQRWIFNKFLDGLVLWMLALVAALVLGMSTNVFILSLAVVAVIAYGIQRLVLFLDTYVTTSPRES